VQKIDQHFRHAAYQYQKRRYDLAVKYYSAGLRENPKSVVGYLDLGKCYEMLGCWPEALAALEQALQLFPRHPTALRRYQRVKEEQRFYQNFQPALPKLLARYCPPFNSANIAGNVIFDIPAELLIKTDELSHLVAFNAAEINSLFHYSHDNQNPVHLALLSSTSISNLETDINDSFLPPWAVAKYQDQKISIRYDTKNRLMKTLFSIVLRHEWVHFVIDQLSYGNCPKWLDEGLAASVSRPMMVSEHRYLTTDQKQLNFVQDKKSSYSCLSRFFTDLSNNPILDYLQSRLFVEWLIEEIGWQPILDSIKKMKNKSQSGDPFQQRIGYSADQLYDSFRKQNFSSKKQKNRSHEYH